MIFFAALYQAGVIQSLWIAAFALVSLYIIQRLNVRFTGERSEE
ncbi:hypothetical protein SD77_0155 [Bacillus badius]|uniref:Uncharacterized protein n=1 Tax=Bacillus badius TaxID=1455 RepID=A0ABR5B025_BACBA|nr:hypothetical protein SD78_3487 [Bacillus badius]KIL80307.1 hypothetical protein SD77_0155 [Bacillus badius]